MYTRYFNTQFAKFDVTVRRCPPSRRASICITPQPSAPVFHAAEKPLPEANEEGATAIGGDATKRRRRNPLRTDAAYWLRRPASRRHVPLGSPPPRNLYIHVRRRSGDLIFRLFVELAAADAKRARYLSLSASPLSLRNRSKR